MATKQREWPNNMKNYRDRAAEEMQESIRQSQQLIKNVQSGEFTRQGLELALLHILRRQITAIRHLEAAGAETVPE